MPVLPPTFRPPGRPSLSEARQDHDRRRGTAAERGYGSAWAKSRASHLRRHPLCRYCALHGRVAVATVVDHFWPHKGDRDLFWAAEWWVSACADCHNGFKARVERQGPPALAALALRLALPPRP